MAVYPWVQMVVFSELAVCGPLTSKAQSLPGSAETALAEAAAKHQIWLVTGSMFERAEDGSIYNTASVIDPNGDVVGRYRKMFVFAPYEQGVAPGEEFFVFDVPGAGRFGMTICYDTWFPEVTRTLASMGAEVILRPTLTGSIDRDVELSITRASAAINQCYLFDINGLGAGGNGRSIVCNPHGQVLHQAGSSEEFIPLEIDFDNVRRSRERGVLTLGQPLKSFRDKPVEFPIYQAGAHSPYLDSLGPLTKPQRLSINQCSSDTDGASSGAYSAAMSDADTPTQENS
ncbi:carbon-nitrogen hydrolase [Salinisphaera hydrothermalis C41B8]|uniref:Carbon-nitrogen hydrolase n=2 Tax=Salinisphaera TaxID=180541 RepID=A0A084IMQ8_SALHC|nr:carbon-nitrogen hydrolase [Salinisphaera hydrothermalis C41B8]